MAKRRFSAEQRSKYPSGHYHDSFDVLFGKIFGRRDDFVYSLIVSIWREGCHSCSSRTKVTCGYILGPSGGTTSFG
jgi:hypothetical protein